MKEHFLFIMQGYKHSIRFSKKGMMKYISHLDLLRLFGRAARRAELPLLLTEGFNPHPKIKIEPALKLGLESDDLRLEVVLNEKISPDKLKTKLVKELPADIEIAEVF